MDRQEKALLARLQRYARRGEGIIATSETERRAAERLAREGKCKRDRQSPLRFYIPRPAE